MADFEHGWHVRVFAIRPGNVPHWIRASRVDSENVGEGRVNSANRGSHVGAFTGHHVLHATCSDRGMRGAGFLDDARVLACTGNHAGSVRG